MPGTSMGPLFENRVCFAGSAACAMAVNIAQTMTAGIIATQIFCQFIPLSQGPENPSFILLQLVPGVVRPVLGSVRGDADYETAQRARIRQSTRDTPSASEGPPRQSSRME